MEYEGELYAERLRRKSQAAALEAGQTQWTDQLDRDVRVKLSVAWTDLVNHMAFSEHAEQLDEAIKRRTLQSFAVAVRPSNMHPRSSSASNEQLLSLIEAEHELLKRIAEQPAADPFWLEKVAHAPETFRAEVNRIFQAHLVAFSLHENSRLVEIQSHEMHNAVVAPTLYLLHSQPRFAAAEKAYQKALDELRHRDPGDAVTDAGTALQDVLKAQGCSGNALGDLLKSARKTGLVKGSDTALTEAIEGAVRWVAAQRNDGEAHRGDADITMSDAWAVVHIVGALIIRLSETEPPPAQR